MKPISHLLFATTIFLIIDKFLNFDTYSKLIFLFIFLFFSILPDVDIFLGIKHRGFTHSIILYIIVFSFLFIILPYLRLIILIFFIATITHLFLDALTPSGIKLLGFTIKGPIRTNSQFELMFDFILVVVLFILIF